jgi:hypothetical protein
MFEGKELRSAAYCRKGSAEGARTTIEPTFGNIWKKNGLLAKQRCLE